MNKLVIISTFWNIKNFAKDLIMSIMNQTYDNYITYLIDDMSTDNSREIINNIIKDDKRFILVKNKIKKFKTKNFIDTIRNNINIDDNDVIIEIDGDDKLSDNKVLEDVAEIYKNKDIWISNSKWVDRNGKNFGNYGKTDAENPRFSKWNFSHMRTYRAFLFRLIKDEHLKYNNEYFKAACDLGYSIPMLEMSVEKHYYFLDRVTYIYSWHSNQTYSINSAVKNPKLQTEIARYIIYKLPKYEKIDREANNLPKGSWINSAKNYKLENNILYADLQKINGKYNPTKIKIKDGISYHNIDGNFEVVKK